MVAAESGFTDSRGDSVGNLIIPDLRDQPPGDQAKLNHDLDLLAINVVEFLPDPVESEGSLCHARRACHTYFSRS